MSESPPCPCPGPYLLSLPSLPLSQAFSCPAVILEGLPPGVSQASGFPGDFLLPALFLFTGSYRLLRFINTTLKNHWLLVFSHLTQLQRVPQEQESRPNCRLG